MSCVWIISARARIWYHNWWYDIMYDIMDFWQYNIAQGMGKVWYHIWYHKLWMWYHIWYHIWYLMISYFYYMISYMSLSYDIIYDIRHIYWYHMISYMISYMVSYMIIKIFTRPALTVFAHFPWQPQTLPPFAKPVDDGGQDHGWQMDSDEERDFANLHPLSY